MYLYINSNTEIPVKVLRWNYQYVINGGAPSFGVALDTTDENFSASLAYLINASNGEITSVTAGESIEKIILTLPGKFKVQSLSDYFNSEDGRRDVNLNLEQVVE